MQQRNNYDKDVFNGDLGYIREVDTEERTLKVDFDGKWVEYDVTELDELTLAYATTIHKAQGSEYPIVVMPVLMTHFVMLQRNLIYTGITRAKKICVLIGATKAGLCRPQYVRAETQYEPSGAVESLPDDRRETPGLNLRQGCRHFLRR